MGFRIRIEFRYAVAGYLGLSEVLKRLDALAEEQTNTINTIILGDVVVNVDSSLFDMLTLSTAEAGGFSVFQPLLHHTGFWAVSKQPLLWRPAP